MDYRWWTPASLLGPAKIQALISSTVHRVFTLHVTNESDGDILLATIMTMINKLNNTSNIINPFLDRNVPGDKIFL
jgi:hypothetical protein